MGQEERKKYKDFGLILGVSLVFFGLSFFTWFGKENSFSESERRVLTKFPDFSVETVFNGKFMKNFETYSLDQFPFRDKFREWKALAAYNIFQNKDNNRIYEVNGYLSKIEYPLNLQMLEYAAGRMENIYQLYLKEQGSKCYFSIVPDKNYFLAKEEGYLHLNYDDLFSYMREAVEFAEYVDITPFLSLEDYYKTDTHWRQEKIVDVAEHLKSAMGGKGEDVQYQRKEWEVPFYGVYCGQSALLVKPDKLYYLTNEMLEQCEVTCYDTGKAEKAFLYDKKKGAGKDGYELFLGGNKALLEIENPKADSGRELVVFRDSFASSLLPLLANQYSKITIIDIRYVQSGMLGNLVDFHGQDVLFLYSTLILNNSLALK